MPYLSHTLRCPGDIAPGRFYQPLHLDDERCKICGGKQEEHVELKVVDGPYDRTHHPADVEASIHADLQRFVDLGAPKDLTPERLVEICREQNDIIRHLGSLLAKTGPREYFEGQEYREEQYLYLYQESRHDVEKELRAGVFADFGKLRVAQFDAKTLQRAVNTAIVKVDKATDLGSMVVIMRNLYAVLEKTTPAIFFDEYTFDPPVLARQDVGGGPNPDYVPDA